MGRQGDYARKEKKKTKKDSKKITPMDVIQAPAEVEVIKKGKKKHEEEEW